MVDALRSLPQSIRTAAFDDNSIAEVRITLSSYDLIALDAGLPIPADAADQAEAESRFIEMAQEQPVDRGGNGGVVFIPIGFPKGSSYGFFGEVEAELGFNLLSIRSVADLVARPYEFWYGTSLGMLSDGLARGTIECLSIGEVRLWRRATGGGLGGTSGLVVGLMVTLLPRR